MLQSFVTRFCVFLHRVAVVLGSLGRDRSFVFFLSKGRLEKHLIADYSICLVNANVD